MHVIEWGHIRSEYPEKWNELNSEQLLFISSLLHSEINRPTFETLLLQKLTGIRWDDFFHIKAEVLADMAKTIDFIFSTKELTKNLFPEIKAVHDNREFTLYGPADGLTDCTVEQFFGYTETYFGMYAENSESKWLDLFFASLYRPRKTEIFNPNDIEIILPAVEKIDTRVKYSALLFYLGCRDFIAYKFPELFSGESKKIQKSDLHFFTLIDSLNNEDITKNEQIKKSNLYETFVRLVQMVKKAENSQKK